MAEKGSITAYLIEFLETMVARELEAGQALAKRKATFRLEKPFTDEELFDMEVHARTYPNDPWEREPTPELRIFYTRNPKDLEKIVISGEGKLIDEPERVNPSLNVPRYGIDKSMRKIVNKKLATRKVREKRRERVRNGLCYRCGERAVCGTLCEKHYLQHRAREAKRPKRIRSHHKRIEAVA